MNSPSQAGRIDQRGRGLHRRGAGSPPDVTAHDMRNIEFKAELRDFDAARTQCRLIGAEFIARVRQVDTYFKLTDGRLKRRETEGEPVEWIYYHRADESRPKLSNYTILSDEQARLRWGTHSLRTWLSVLKTRELWMLENVRVHLDEIDDLGAFIEFEAIVSREHSVKECHELIAELRQRFGPVMNEPISLGYSDLMEQLINIRSLG